MNKETINISHGGNLELAAQTFAIPREQWLDLSTGIAPWSWPIPEIPTAVWQRLPAVACPLPVAAADYYGCKAEAVLAIPGSQFAIQCLPQLFPDRTRVAIPQLGYFEHRKAWQQAGHQLFNYSDDDLDQLETKIKAAKLDVVLVINPNNPTTAVQNRDRLLHWCDLLARRGGCLLVDEAFMDADARMSLASQCPRPGLIVLRSLGKFFGLAGLRLGFVLAESHLLELLSEKLGPWAVNGPAQYLGCLAMADKVWHAQQKQRIERARTEQMALLNAAPWGANVKVSQGPLYCTISMPKKQVEQWYQRCGRQGILVRRFVQCEHECDSHGLLRFGLAGDAEQLQRLKQVLLATEVSRDG